MAGKINRFLVLPCLSPGLVILTGVNFTEQSAEKMISL